MPPNFVELTDRFRRAARYLVEVEGNVATRADGTPILFPQDKEGLQRIVYAEVLIPDVPNVFGDFHTKEMVRDFAYGFMSEGFGLDVNHDNVVRADLSVVESFIARKDDPDFIEGSWVVGVYVGDDEVWQMVRNGDITGFSWEGYVLMVPGELEMAGDFTRIGSTEPDIGDGHTHEFFAILDDDGRVIAGGTTETDGHSHLIRSHTFTEKAENHSHIYNLVIGEGGI